MERALYEVRHALRRLWRTPGFSVAALITLSLGIVANAPIFSVVNATFLCPLSYLDPNRLVWATEFYPKFNRSMVPAPEYAAWKAQSVAFERIEAIGPTFGANLVSSRSPAVRVETAHETSLVWAPDSTMSRFGYRRKRRALAGTVRPMRHCGPPARLKRRQARVELERIARAMDHQYPSPWARDHAAARVRIVSLREQLTADSQTATAVLMGAVGFLLLIACANVANLF